MEVLVKSLDAVWVKLCCFFAIYCCALLISVRTVMTTLFYKHFEYFWKYSDNITPILVDIWRNRPPRNIQVLHTGSSFWFTGFNALMQVAPSYWNWKSTTLPTVLWGRIITGFHLPTTTA